MPRCEAACNCGRHICAPGCRCSRHSPWPKAANAVAARLGGLAHRGRPKTESHRRALRDAALRPAGRRLRRENGLKSKGRLLVDRIVRPCEYCGLSIKRTSYKARLGRWFCSRRCASCWTGQNRPRPRRDVTFVCEGCGNKITKAAWRRLGKHKFCNHGCQGRWQGKHREYPRGRDHPSWKGGLAAGWSNFYLNDRWLKTAALARQRDKNRCQDCNAKGTKLHVHHVIPITENGPKYRLSNLLTLCNRCHHAQHRRRRIYALRR